LNFVTSIAAVMPAIGGRFTQAVTKGWQVSPIFTAYTGQPFTITDGGKDISLSGQLQDRPNVILPNQVIPATQTTKEWFNQAAFATQPTGTFGDSGRFNLYGPGTWNMDVSLSRTFALTKGERFKLESRVEAFNIFNHANWNSPTVSITSSTFGQITSFSSPRILQVALKLSY
jgi:hypothetical protein